MQGPCGLTCAEQVAGLSLTVNDKELVLQQVVVRWCGTFCTLLYTRGGYEDTERVEKNNLQN